MGAKPSSDRYPPAGPQRYWIAVITLDQQMFGRCAGRSPSFRATLASAESQIETLIDDPGIHGIVLDLEGVGDRAADGIEVLQEMRRLEDDLIMVAITASNGSELPLQASQARGRPFLPRTGRGQQLQTLLLQTVGGEFCSSRDDGCWSRSRPLCLVA